MEPLFVEHYDDLSLHRHLGIPLSPHHAVYEAKDQAGELVLVTLREDGELAGYCTVFVGRSMHYDMLTAVPDLLYVRFVTRRRVFAVYRRLLRSVETELRRRGVLCWFQGFKVHRSAKRLFAAMGFEPFDEYVVKWLPR